MLDSGDVLGATSNSSILMEHHMAELREERKCEKSE